MSEQTSISWTDATFNPWIGCTKVSPGCDNCYAARQDKFRSWTPEGWGAGKPRRRTSASNWLQPLRWNKRAEQEGRRIRVFCSSLADVFDNEVPETWREDLLDLVGRTPSLDWLLLTKRIGNVQRMLNDLAVERAAAYGGDVRDHAMLPTNVWLGATIVNQEEADRDIPKLLAIPARVRFLSMEPLLGPVEFSNVTRRSDAVAQLGKPALSGIHWVITGGESGPGARPYAVEWARSIVAQCEAAGVAVHVKQLGAHVITTGISGPGQHWPRETGLHDTGLGHFRKHLVDRAGGDTAEWPEDLRVQEFPA